MIDICNLAVFVEIKTQNYVEIVIRCTEESDKEYDDGCVSTT